MHISGGPVSSNRKGSALPYSVKSCVGRAKARARLGRRVVATRTECSMRGHGARAFARLPTLRGSKRRFANDRFELFAIFFSAPDRNRLLGFSSKSCIDPFLCLDGNCSFFSSCGAARSGLAVRFGIESLDRNTFPAAKPVSIDRLCDFSILRD